jgi:germination protein M
MKIGTNKARRANRHAARAAAAFFVLLAVTIAVGCGGSATPQPTATVTLTTSPSTLPAATSTLSPSPSLMPTMTVSVYFMRPIGGTQPDHGPFIATAHRTIPATTATARAATNALLVGPTSKEKGIGMATAIPSGTTLRGLTISGGVATVDLSGAFASGGGTLSMTGRLAQVVYTLTQFPTVSKGVVFKVDGKTVTVFGGEGIMLTHPQTRSDYESVTPPIFVDRPAAFGEVSGSALKVSGTADVFEATFRAKLVDSNGSTLAQKTVMATSGSGTRGTFSFTLAIPAGVSAGKLVVWDDSMKDGSPLHKVTIPLSFSP